MTIYVAYLNLVTGKQLYLGKPTSDIDIKENLV